MPDYTVFDLMDDIERMNRREEAMRRIMGMEDAEKLFVLGLLRHEEQTRGQAGVEAVIRWIAEREPSALG